MTTASLRQTETFMRTWARCRFDRRAFGQTWLWAAFAGWMDTLELRYRER